MSPKPMDVTATTSKERKPAKVLEELRIKEAENGGHIITHHFTHYDHSPEDHVFGADEGAKAHAHIAEHMSMPMKAEKEEA